VVINTIYFSETTDTAIKHRCVSFPHLRTLVQGSAPASVGGIQTPAVLGTAARASLAVAKPSQPGQGLGSREGDVPRLQRWPAEPLRLDNARNLTSSFWANVAAVKNTEKKASQNVYIYIYIN